MKQKEFEEIVQMAIDDGFRKCYIKKVDAHLLFKGNIYFNLSGIYEYKNYRFNKLGELTKENLQKFTPIFCFFKEDKKGHLETTAFLKKIADKIKEK